MEQPPFPTSESYEAELADKFIPPVEEMAQSKRIIKEWLSLWGPIDALVRPLTRLGGSVAEKAVELIKLGIGAKSGGLVTGDNYAAGLWSRRNVEAMIEDGNVVNPSGSIPDDVREIVRRIADWELPETGEFWEGDKSRPMSYESCWGSNGVRDYVRNLALQAFELITKPNLPSAEQPKLSVWYGKMPESNGKDNWAAVLHRADDEGFEIFTDGMTIARSEYPDRVRYEADCVRWIIGELKEKPFILDYDSEKHSEYVWPINDSARLEWMVKNGAFIGWSKDGEKCAVYSRCDDEFNELNRLNHNQSFREPFEAIDHAMGISAAIARCEGDRS